MRGIEGTADRCHQLLLLRAACLPSKHCSASQPEGGGGGGGEAS